MLMLTPDQIKRIRKALGMNSTEFASLLGVTQNTVARWEIGDRHPRWEMMEKINNLAIKHRIELDKELTKVK